MWFLDRASESSELAALPRKRCGRISTRKSRSSSSPRDESQRSSESDDESVLLVPAELPHDEPAHEKDV